MNKSRRAVLKSLAASAFLPALARGQAGAPVKLAMIEGLSGGNANGGEAVFRNLVWAVERVNQRGGVKTRDGVRCDPLTVRDAYSRFVLELRIMRQTDEKRVRAVFEKLFYPVP